MVKSGNKWVKDGSVKLKVEKPKVENKTLTGTKKGAVIDGLKNLSGLTNVKPTSWTSSNEGVATVNSSTGVITTQGKGTAKITAFFGSEKNAAKYSFYVKVKVPAVSKENVTLLTGQTVKLSMKNTKLAVKWESSDKTIADVDSDGKVTAYKSGDVIVKGIVEDVPYECKVTVKAPTIRKDKLTVRAGKTD